MFFSSSIKSTDLAETIRSRYDLSMIRNCAELLREELKSYNFGLSKSYFESNDLIIMINLLPNRPELWGSFFKVILSCKDKPAANQLICDNDFSNFLSYDLRCVYPS